MKKRLPPLLSVAAIVLAAFLGSQLSAGCGGSSESDTVLEAYAPIGERIDKLGGEVSRAVHGASGEDAAIAAEFADFGETAGRYAGEVATLQVPSSLRGERNELARDLKVYAAGLNFLALAAKAHDVQELIEGVHTLVGDSKLLNDGGRAFLHALEEEG